MASLLLKTNTRPLVHPFPKPVSFRSPALIIPFRFNRNRNSSLLHASLRAASSGANNFIRKPLGKGGIAEETDEIYYVDADEEEVVEHSAKADRWVDWEDQILADTVPLVGFVRMILHSGRYQAGDRLSPEHEKTVLEKLLPFHPESEKKIGSGVDYVMIGYHPDFDQSKCLFLVRQDGEQIDFSYWKCIKGLIRKNYPLYADSFILRHFRNRSRNL